MPDTKSPGSTPTTPAPGIDPRFDTVLAFLNQALPVVPPVDRAFFPGPATIYAALDAGIPEAQIATDLATAVRALGIPVDASGQYQSARHAAFTGEFNVQDLLARHWTEGLPMPSDQEFRDRIFPQPLTPPGPGTPADPQPPAGPVGQYPFGVGQPAADQRFRDIEARLATVEARVQGLRDWAGSAPSGPGVA